MLAAASGSSDIVALLLENGAPWNAVDRRGLCAGDYAASAGHEQAFEIIVDAGVPVCRVLTVVEPLSAAQRRNLQGRWDQRLNYITKMDTAQFLSEVPADSH